MAELISITEAAKLIGLSRPRTSKIIKAHKIKKVKQGTNFLVEKFAILQLIEDLRIQGKTRKAVDVSDEPAVTVVTPHSEPQIRAGAQKDDAALLPQETTRLHDLIRETSPSETDSFSPGSTTKWSLIRVLKDSLKPWG